MCMTQLVEPLQPLPIVEPGSRDSTVVPCDGEWTNRISSVMPAKAPERIVVVSNHPASLRKPCRALEQDGYELSYASPEALLDIVEQVRADLLLVDMAPSPSAALELCRHLRKRPSPCHETIVLVSRGESDEDLIASALLAGADDCVVIGRRTSELLARVRVQF